MQCPDCGYEWDEVNESISICPRCGTDPNDPNSWPDPLDHPLVIDALAELPDIKCQEEERKLHEEPGDN
jgi:hypothetical protein